MKKLICALLIAMLAASPALAADAPQLSGGLIGAAKRAAVYLAAGEFDRMAELPFSEGTPDADGWRDFANRFSFTGRAQAEYAVAYWVGDAWHIAVPLEVPENGAVETLMLLSVDGERITGCRRSYWGEVESELAGSDHITWDREYVGSAPKVFVD